MKSKRGSHVGIILSFVMFVTFLIFLYSILEPQLKVEKDKEAFLEYLKRDLMQEFYGGLTVVVTKSANEIESKIPKDENCMSIPVGEIDVVGKNYLVRASDEILVGGEFSDSGEFFNYDWDGDKKKFYKIYFAEEGFVSLPEYIGFDCVDGEIKLVNKKEYIFESKIKEIIKIYNDKGFEKVAENLSLNIPAGSEFGLKFLDKERTELYSTNEGNVSVSIFSEELPIQYVDEEANILPGFIVLRVW